MEKLIIHTTEGRPPGVIEPMTNTTHLRLVASDGGGASGPGNLVADDPITQLEVDHALQLELCDVLEYLADGLPHEVDLQLAEVAIAILRNGVPQHTAIEEQVLFPLLRRRMSLDPKFLAMLDQLENEHESDESFAEEIAQELERLIEMKKPRNPEMLGYMLRGFFVAQRRHIEWENNTIIPAARRNFTAEDIAEMNAGVRSDQKFCEGRRMLASIPEEFSAAKCSGECEDCKSKNAE